MFDVIVTQVADDALISVDEVKDHLHITGTDDDDYLEVLIDQVIKDVEGFCGISIGEQERQWIFDAKGNCEYVIPYGPVSSVDTVEEKTAYQTYEPLSVGNGYDTDGEGRVTFTPFFSGRFKIGYTCGFTDLPAGLKLGILNEIAYRYENRGDEGKGFSADALGLIIKHKDFSWE